LNRLDDLKTRIRDLYGLLPRPEWDPVLREILSAKNASWLDNTTLRALMGRLTIDESHFLRHRDQVEFAADWIFGRLQAGPKRGVLRVWSAGCCRGEEPYSVVIALLERIPSLLPGGCDILGTDVNPEAIRLARQGFYNEWSMRGVPDAIREKYFERRNEFSLALKPEVKRFVRFEHLSIQEQLAAFEPGVIDLILFRNVAVYMDAGSAGRVYEEMARVLAPDGILILSATDPRPERRIFAPANRENHCILRPFSEEETGKAAIPAAPPVSRPPRPAGSKPAPRPVKSPTPLEALLSEATVLGDRGELETAIRTAGRAISAHPRSKIAFELRGRLLVAAHRLKEAAADFDRVLALDPDDHLARFWYAEALRGGGASSRSIEALKELERRLHPLDDGNVLDDDSVVTVRELKAAARSMREALE
jgi:chemotaxis protein methyltransferase CheR